VTIWTTGSIAKALLPVSSVAADTIIKAKALHWLGIQFRSAADVLRDNDGDAGL
jgi:hypothetical protein